MQVLAYAVRPRIHLEVQRKSMLLKPESGTPGQYFTVAIGVEYLVQGKI
jgi:hypothetical protein